MTKCSFSRLPFSPSPKEPLYEQYSTLLCGCSAKICHKRKHWDLGAQNRTRPFFTGKVLPKRKLWIKKIENEVILEAFRSDKLKKRVKIVKIITFIFQCVAKKERIKGWLKLCTSYMVVYFYNQIWLNLGREDHQFFPHLPGKFLTIIATLATLK